MNPRHISDCLAELAEVRALVRGAKRDAEFVPDYFAPEAETRSSLYIADARLGRAIAVLQAALAAWEEESSHSPLATLNSPLSEE